MITPDIAKFYRYLSWQSPGQTLAKSGHILFLSVHNTYQHTQCIGASRLSEDKSHIKDAPTIVVAFKRTHHSVELLQAKASNRWAKLLDIHV